MPASNTTPATATVIPSLPYSVQQAVDGGANSLYPPPCELGAVETPVWFTYTPVPGETAVGFYWAKATPAAQYQPMLSVYTADAFLNLTAVTDCCFENDDEYQQINVTPGVVYYFQFTNRDTSSPIADSDLIFSVVTAPVGSFAIGDFLIANDTSNFPAAILDGATGALKSIFAFAAFECADILADGTILVAAENTQVTGGDTIYSYNLYNALLALQQADTGTPISNQSPISPVRSDGVSTFYCARVDNAFPAVRRTTVVTIDSAGVVGGTTWTLPGNADRMSCMAPNRAGTILYYGTDVAGDSAIYRYDLVNSLALSNLLASAGGLTRLGRDLYVLADGTILTVYRLDLTSTGFQVRRYDTSGTLLNTYTLGTSVQSSPRISLGLNATAATSFWVMTFPAIGTTRLQEISLASGAVLTTFNITQSNAIGGNTIQFGPSQSCPLLMVQVAAVVPQVLVLSIDCVNFLITITGTNFAVNAIPRLWGPPNGDELTPLHIVSQTDTEIVVQLPAAFISGQYCALVENP